MSTAISRTGSYGLILVASSLILAGCTSAVPTAGEATVDDPAYGTGSGLTDVHAVDVDDERERLTIATHEGLLLVDLSPSADPTLPPVILGEYGGDVMGFVRRDDRLLLSGHPALGSSDPGRVGIIESTLDADAWSDLALGGEVDFHAMSTSPLGQSALIAGLDSSSGRALTSADGGRTWEAGIPIAALDIAVVPESDGLVVTTESGPQLSLDRGASWQLIEGAPLLVLVESGADITGASIVVGVDVDGVLHSSRDGREWKKLADVPMLPAAFGVGAQGTIVLATTTAAVASRDGGLTWSTIADLSLAPTPAG